jgi:hypothetical protein
MTDLKAAVFTVLEGWALPLDARKILETAYYAQPEREWVGLTDDEIDTYAQQHSFSPDKAPEWFTEVCRDIEAKLKEKNA